MFESIRRRLSAKLFLAFLAIIFVGAIIMIVTVQIAAPGAFNRHMAGMGDGTGMGGMMGQGQGPGLGQGLGAGMMQGFYADFRSSLNEAIGWAVAAAMVVAVVISYGLSRRIVAPLQAMTSASRRIAEGHYDERVKAMGVDEVGQLAGSFNQMAAQLEQVEAMRRQLIGDVSHELRTPLTAIKGSMEGLIDGVIPATPETFQQLHAEAGRLSRLVDDLQELSRVEARAYQLDLADTDLAALIETTIKRLTPTARAKRITLTSSLPRPLPHLLADEHRLGQVLTNLTANAIQYTPTDGTVTISVMVENNEIQVAVTDTGIGIPPEHLKNIFTRFYRIDKSRSRAAGGGSGIGLTIARHFVEAHGGRIWAESEGDGKGSRFVFTLPM